MLVALKYVRASLWKYFGYKAQWAGKLYFVMMSLKSYFGADSGTGTQHTSGGRWDRSDKPTSNPPPFPDHHHYHSFIIKWSDKTTSFRPHHASLGQILKYPINFFLVLNLWVKIVVVYIYLSVSKPWYIHNDEVCLSQKISGVCVTSPLFCRISVRGSQTGDEVSGLRLSGTPARTTKCFVSIIIRSSVVTGAKRGRFRRR